MSEEILINVTPRETRVALVENGILQEVYIERAQRRGLVGKIYRGKVCRVLPNHHAVELLFPTYYGMEIGSPAVSTWTLIIYAVASFGLMVVIYHRRVIRRT
jgi:hypothetical protein